MTLDQPPPSDGAGPAIWDLVIDDMRDRDAKGVETYRERLRACNGRDTIWDEYEELLDQTAYKRQQIEERNMALIELDAAELAVQTGEADRAIEAIRKVKRMLGGDR